MGGAFPLRDSTLVARPLVNASVESVVETAGCILADVDIRGGCEMGASTPVSSSSVLSEWVSLEVESLLPLGVEEHAGKSGNLCLRPENYLLGWESLLGLLTEGVPVWLARR